MAEAFLDALLKHARDMACAERIRKRDDMYCVQRQIVCFQGTTEYIEFTEDEVINIARLICSGSNDLKEKSLTTLKSALLLHAGNILSFMKVEGALHALVGCLMSQNPVEQLLAAECCSNLSMGDSKTCFKLAKAASPYIITILQGLNYNLMNACILTIFNLSGSGEKTCELLYSQGIIKALEKNITVPELQENTMNALISLTKNGSKFLTEAEVKSLLSKVLPHFEQLPSSHWLAYLLSSLPYVIPILIENDIPLKILDLLGSVRRIRSDNILSVTSLVRLLGNLSADPDGITADIMISRWEMITRIFKSFIISAKYRHLSKEIYWSVGNILQHKNPKIQRKLAHVDFSWVDHRIPFPNT